MIPMASPQSASSFSLFDSVPNDYFNFGEGGSFQPRVVPDVLGLRREDVSRLASVSLKSVRYDDAIPEQVRERLEEIAITINMVAKFFDGDTDKTVTWFKPRRSRFLTHLCSPKADPPSARLFVLGRARRTSS